MTQRSRLRKLAKRLLPAVVLGARRRIEAQAIAAKQPGLPRAVQRQLKLQAREAARAKAAELKQLMAPSRGGQIDIKDVCIVPARLAPPAERPATGEAADPSINASGASR